MRRFYVWRVSGNRVQITGSDAFHIVRVLRLRKGSVIEVVDETQTIYEIELEKVSPECVEGRIVNRFKGNTEPEVRITLYQSVGRLSVMDDVMGTASELGCVRIVPVFTERSPVKEVSNSRLERWRRVVRERAKQVGREIVPNVFEPVSIQEIDEVIEEDVRIALWEGVDEPNLIDAVGSLKKGDSVGVFIGPEGGLAEKDVEVLRDYGFGFASLGRRILKVHTATAVALGVVLLQSFRLD